MRKVTYSAVLYSLAIHGLILILIILTQATSKKTALPISKNPPIKSYIYYPPKPPKSSVEEKVLSPEPIEKQLTQTKLTPEKIVEIPATKQVKRNANNADNLPTALANTAPINPAPRPEPEREKLDSFTQLQRLRSKLNQSASKLSDNPYQRYQPPSTFNIGAKPVPHSVPVKDEEKQRQANTQDMGAGVAITKGENGVCSVAQDMRAYGLSEGSSRQYFSCGESKFDKSFRQHMQKVQAKLRK